MMVMYGAPPWSAIGQACSLRGVSVELAWSFRYKCARQQKECRLVSDSLIVFSPFRLDLRNEQLWREGAFVPVRPKPFAVLAYLATHAGCLVTAAELRKAV